MQKTVRIPWAITSLRIAVTPFILWFLSIGNYVLFSALFLFSLITDIADGLVARRLKATSRKGAYFDAIADFCLISGVFLIYTIRGLYPYWILTLIIVSFTQFLLTSLRRIQIYDPVGKYFGGLLFVIIIVMGILRIDVLYTLSLQVIAGFFSVSLASRIVYFGLYSKRRILHAQLQSQGEC
jgi:phosphatidylglycerophosphate synthase